MKKTIELIRVSTENQANDDRASIPAQRTINRKTAAAFGLTIYLSIEITDVGGSDVLKAPEIQELVRLIQDPEVHGVVAREFSRLMRPENLGDFILLQAFADSKTLLYLPDGPIDFATKTGRLLGTIRAAIAGLEKSEFLERSFSSREEMRRQGKCPSAPHTRPYGVGYEDERGWFYLPEVEKVRRAFELFRSGVSNFGELERETGLTRFNLRNILANPIYMGWRVYDKKRDQSKAGLYTSIDGRQSGRRKMCRTPEEVIRVKVIDDPIISESEFAHIQEMLTAKRDRHLRARHSTESRFVYHGFLACAACGEVEYTKTYTSRAGLISDYYACSGKQSYQGNRPNPVAADQRCPTPYMRRERLETHLDQLFAVRLTDRGFLRELVDELEVRQSGLGSKPKLARLEARIHKLDEKRQRILDGFFEGVISREDRETRIDAVDKDRVIALKSLAEENPSHPEIDAGMLVDLFRPLCAWAMLRAEAKRRILFSLVPEIKVANYKVAGMSLLVPSLCGAEPSTRKPSVSDRGLSLRRESFGYYANHHKKVC